MALCGQKPWVVPDLWRRCVKARNRFVEALEAQQVLHMRDPGRQIRYVTIVWHANQFLDDPLMPGGLPHASRQMATRAPDADVGGKE